VHLKLKVEIREAERRYAAVTKGTSTAQAAPATLALSLSEESDGESSDSVSVWTKSVDLEVCLHAQNALAIHNLSRLIFMQKKITAGRGRLLILRKEIYQKNKVCHVHVFMHVRSPTSMSVIAVCLRIGSHLSRFNAYLTSP
jgi:hypothetical protein